MLCWLKKIFADDVGNPSWMRLIGGLVALVIVSAWAFCVFKSGQWIPLDGWAAGIVGSVFGGKAVQKLFESTGGDDVS